MVAQSSPWSPNAGIMVTTVIVQCRLLVAQSRHKGGRRGFKASPRLRNWVLQQNAFITGQHFASHCASLLQLWQCVCVSPFYMYLIWATFEWPTFSATFVRLFWTCSKLDGDHGVHGGVWTSCVPLWTTKATLLLPSSLQWRPGQFYERGTKVAGSLERGYQ